MQFFCVAVDISFASGVAFIVDCEAADVLVSGEWDDVAMCSSKMRRVFEVGGDTLFLEAINRQRGMRLSWDHVDVAKSNAWHMDCVERDLTRCDRFMCLPVIVEE